MAEKNDSAWSDISAGAGFLVYGISNTRSGVGDVGVELLLNGDSRWKPLFYIDKSLGGIGLAAGVVGNSADVLDYVARMQQVMTSKQPDRQTSSLRSVGRSASYSVIVAG